MKINLENKTGSIQIKNGDFITYKRFDNIFTFIFISEENFIEEDINDYKYYALHLLNSDVILDDFDDFISEECFFENTPEECIMMYLEEKGLDLVEIIPSEQIEIRRINK